MAPHVLVLGGGISGLICASQLSSRGVQVTLLEARKRLGGRINTLELPQGKKADSGASWIHTVDGNPLVDLAKEAGCEFIVTSPGAGLIVQKDGSAVSEDVMSQILVNAFLAFFESSRTFAQAEASPSHTRSLASYLFSSASPLYKDLSSQKEKQIAEQVVKAFSSWTGADLDSVSLRYWGFERDFKGDDALVLDGYSKIIKFLEDQIVKNGGEIRLGEEVTSIRYDDDAEEVEVITGEKSEPAATPPFREYRAPYVICTLPLGVLQRRPPQFTPPLPPRRLQSISRLGSGVLNKVIVSYPSIWWDNAESLDFISFLPRHSMPLRSLRSRGMQAQTYVPYNNEPIVVLYLGGSAGIEVESLSDGEAQTWVHSLMLKSLQQLPGTTIPEPNFVKVTKWNKDRYSHGSYSFIPTANTKDVARGEEPPSPLDMIELSRPVYDGRLGFAGEATESDHYASVHGALISGRREAARVIAALGDEISEEAGEEEVENIEEIAEEEIEEKAQMIKAKL